MWISYLRGQRNVQLWTARSETRNERRRRVAAETAQRMQAMARALTTAADPAQVADAVFAALRDELQVDAATFALLDERGTLRTLRRFGYDPDEPIGWGAHLARSRTDRCWASNVAFFAESLDDLRRQRPDIYASLCAATGSDPWPSCRWSSPTAPSAPSSCTGTTTASISEPDRSFLFTITGAAAQAVERARLTLTEFVNLERSQHLHQLSSALAAATTPGDVAACRHRRRPAGARVRSPPSCGCPPPGERALSCLASSGHPGAALARRWCPWTAAHAGACFTRGRTVMATIDGGRGGRTTTWPRRSCPGCWPSFAEPVTIVTEPLVGQRRARSACCRLAFVAQPEPSEPDLRFLSTLAGLTAQALERAQLFEHEREALRAAEAGRERLSLLSEVTRLLSSSLEPTTVIRRTMSLVEGQAGRLVHRPGAGRQRARPPRRARSRGRRHAARSRSGKAQESVPFGLRRAGRRRLPDGAHPAGPARRRRRTRRSRRTCPRRSPSR